jgi:hypothetical protein
VILTENPNYRNLINEFKELNFELMNNDELPQKRIEEIREYTTAVFELLYKIDKKNDVDFLNLFKEVTNVSTLIYWKDIDRKITV